MQELSKLPDLVTLSYVKKALIIPWSSFVKVVTGLLDDFTIEHNAKLLCKTIF